MNGIIFVMSDGPLEGFTLSTLNWNMFSLEIFNDIEPIIHAIDNDVRLENEAKQNKTKQYKAVSSKCRGCGKHMQCTRWAKKDEGTHVISIYQKYRGTSYGSRLISCDAFVSLRAA